MSREAILELFDAYGAEILDRQRQAELEPVPEAFHQMRVHVKRARALLELVDAIAPRFRRRRAMRVFRDAFRAAGSVRDLHVQIGIASELGSAIGASVAPWLALLEQRERDAVNAWLASASRIAPADLALVREEIEGALGRLHWVGLASGAWTHFNARLRAVREFDAHGADLHDLRKRVKECSNLTWIIAATVPELTIDERLSLALDKLQKLLGDWHDFDVAVHTTAELTTGQPAAARPDGWDRFLDSIEYERRRLRDKVLRKWVALARLTPPGVDGRLELLHDPHVTSPS
jgi:CHAD domain-containing protein